MTRSLDRGDVVWLDLDPQAGHEQAGRRPALVISPAAYNVRSGLIMLCPITSRRKGGLFEVEIPPGYDVTGVVLADQVKSQDWRARRAEWVCHLPPSVVEETLAKLEPLAT